MGTEGFARNPGSPAIRSAMEDDDVDESVLDFASEVSWESSDAAKSESPSPASLRFSDSASETALSDMVICSDCSERSVGGASFEVKSETSELASGDQATWRVGYNCGPWVVTFDEQAQVLVANATANLRRLPTQTCKDVLRALGREDVPGDRHTAAVVALLGLPSMKQVRTNWDRAARDGAPRQTRDPPARQPGEEASGVSADARRQALLVRVREAVHQCAWGRACKTYVQAVERMEMVGVRLGTKYNHHAFLERVEHMSYVSCQAFAAIELNQLTPSTGVPPEIAVTWDGVGIGGTTFSRAETTAIIAVSFMNASGRIVQRLVESPSENLRKAGADQKELVLEALARHPARLTLPELRKRLRLVAGDGAICKGGVDAIHGSTGAGEGLWAEVFGPGPEPCTEWDLFHRIDAALTHVMKTHGACVEYTAVARACGA